MGHSLMMFSFLFLTLRVCYLISFTLHFKQYSAEVQNGEYNPRVSLSFKQKINSAEFWLYHLEQVPPSGKCYILLNPFQEQAFLWLVIWEMLLDTYKIALVFGRSQEDQTDNQHKQIHTCRTMLTVTARDKHVSTLILNNLNVFIQVLLILFTLFLLFHF